MTAGVAIAGTITNDQIAAAWNAGLRPTHTCFDDALFMILQLTGAEVLHFTLVHALCDGAAFGPDEPPYMHAWVLQRHPTQSLIWQAGRAPSGQRIFYALTPDDHAAVYTVKHSTQYTPRLVIELVKLHDCSGPWRPEYRAAQDADQARRRAGGGAAPRIASVPARIRPVQLGVFDSDDGSIL